jgi:hypothetical protein
MAISAPSFQLFDELRAEHKADQELWAVISASDCGMDWRIIDDLITVYGRPFVATSSPLLPSILAHTHDTRLDGADKTLHHLRADFHTPGECGAVRDFMRSCEVCQCNYD